MKLIEPKVELLSELDISPESHIARCARVCYGKEHKEPNQEADKKMVEGLMKREHLSMLRHGSMYLSHIEDIPKYLETHILTPVIGTIMRAMDMLLQIFKSLCLMKSGCQETFVKSQ